MTISNKNLGIRKYVENYTMGNELIEGKEIGLICSYGSFVDNYLVINGIVVSGYLSGCNIPEALETMHNNGREGFFMPSTYIQRIYMTNSNLSLSSDERDRDNLRYLEYNRNSYGPISKSGIDYLSIINQLRKGGSYDNELTISLDDKTVPHGAYPETNRLYIESNYGLDAIMSGNGIKNTIDEKVMWLVRTRIAQLRSNMINWNLVPTTGAISKKRKKVNKKEMDDELKEKIELFYSPEGTMGRYNSNLNQRMNQNKNKQMEKNQYGYCIDCNYCNRTECDKFKDTFHYGKKESIRKDLEYLYEKVTDQIDKNAIKRYLSDIEDNNIRPREVLDLIEQLVEENNIGSGASFIRKQTELANNVLSDRGKLLRELANIFR